MRSVDLNARPVQFSGWNPFKRGWAHNWYQSLRERDRFDVADQQHQYAMKQVDEIHLQELRAFQELQALAEKLLEVQKIAWNKASERLKNAEGLMPDYLASPLDIFHELAREAPVKARFLSRFEPQRLPDVQYAIKLLKSLGLVTETTPVFEEYMVLTALGETLYKEGLSQDLTHSFRMMVGDGGPKMLPVDWEKFGLDSGFCFEHNPEGYRRNQEAIREEGQRLTMENFRRLRKEFGPLED